MKKTLLSVILVLALILGMSASACTMIYVGGDYTSDGSAFYGRSEDYYNSRNKLYEIIPAGAISGTYKGCSAYGGGFTMELAKEGYQFITFAEDNADGICPECFEEADHLAYTEAGTNEMGVTVSATETLRGNELVTAVDPYRNGEIEGLPIGIEETDIPTVILSQAATAKEGVELLLSIYDTYGCQDAAGLIIADKDEIWYIENCSGTQYIAIKLNDSMLLCEPNMAIIGAIDLDDTENVIASANIISVAKEAGCFVGDEEANVINFRASYSRLSIDNRLVSGLNFLDADLGATAESLEADNSQFTISNIDAEGNIVALYSNVKTDRELNIDDVVNYYKISGIGRDRNADTSIFQFVKNADAETATIEWVALNNCAYNVFIPYYPMLTTETYEGFRKGTGAEGAGFTVGDTIPEADMYYKGTQWVCDENGNWERAEGYVSYPDGWKDSYYWCFDALSNYILYREATEEQAANVLSELAALQTEIYDTFATMQAAIGTNDNLASFMTETSNAMAEKAQALALNLWTAISAQ